LAKKIEAFLSSPTGYAVCCNEEGHGLKRSCHRANGLKDIFSLLPSPRPAIIRRKIQTDLLKPPSWKEVVMTGKKSLFLVFVCGALLSLCIAGPLCGQDITPALEQEFLDAKAALATAQKAQGDKYSAENMAKAQELLNAAESVRPLKDGAQFAQMSRLARAYAELAKAVAELKIDQENLAATNDDLKKVKAEIEQLKKGQ